MASTTNTAIPEYNRRVTAPIVSALHLLALAIGLPSVFLRGRALGGRLDRDGIRRVLVADTVWGLAALLWVATGLLRAFAGLEKGTAFYLNSNLFWVKMALFVAIVILEVRPAMTFMRWRADIRRGRTPDTASARLLYALNHAQMVLVVAMVFVAAFMARGFGQR
jgi:putative membrane protein